MTYHATITSALEDAEREVSRASHKADRAYAAWKLNPNKSTWDAWGHAINAEHKAEQALRDLELAMDAEMGWVL